MEQTETIAIIERVITLEAQQKILNAEIETLKDKLKAELASQGVDRMQIGGYKVSNTKYTTHRFDSKTFKADHADMYEQYTKAIEASRFSIA